MKEIATLFNPLPPGSSKILLFLIASIDNDFGHKIIKKYDVKNGISITEAR